MTRRRCGSEISRRFQGSPLALRDLGHFSAALTLTAALAWLVHPLFWSLAFVAIAWFLGRDVTEAADTHSSV